MHSPDLRRRHWIRWRLNYPVVGSNTSGPLPTGALAPDIWSVPTDRQLCLV
jgi:hypothetical protein